MRSYQRIGTTCFLAATLFAPELYAQSLTGGTYTMNDGKVSGSFSVVSAGANKYVFEGGTKTATGAECMLSGPGTYNGSELEIGYKCTVRLSTTGKQIIIDDYKKCIPCDPGAYISGSYNLE